MADGSGASALDLASVISTDQALTAQLIRLSNSAYYGFARRVGTVREAVVLLGFRQVRQIAVGASLMTMFKTARTDDGFDLDLFWGHSVAVAVAGEAYAKRIGAAKPEDVFTAGILHDIGRLVIRRAMPAEFAQAVAWARTGQVSLHLAEVRCTGYGHDEVGRVLGQRWKFPSHLIDAIGRHHNAGLTPGRDGCAGIIAQANRLALHHGLYCGFEIADEERAPFSPDVAAMESACGGIGSVVGRAFTFIEGAVGTPATWYAKSA
jgi:putative nucleotidyltransferase with HDIG domain